MTELRERQNALRDTVDVDRICTVVEVSGRTVITEKMIAVKFEAAAKVGLELIGVQIPANAVERGEIVSGMEIVYPGVGRRVAIKPGTVLLLSSRRVTGNA